MILIALFKFFTKFDLCQNAEDKVSSILVQVVPQCKAVCFLPSPLKNNHSKAVVVFGGDGWWRQVSKYFVRPFRTPKY